MSSYALTSLAMSTWSDLNNPSYCFVLEKSTICKVTIRSWLSFRNVSSGSHHPCGHVIISLRLDIHPMFCTLGFVPRKLTASVLGMEVVELSVQLKC